MLELDPAALLAEHGGTTPYKVVANLPYYAANPILRRFLECSARPTLLVLLLQREVAESIAAKPGAMSILSVAVQRYTEPKVVGIVKPGSFYPPPKVESAIVRLAGRPAPLLAPDSETDALMAVVRAGFSAPRKQIAGPLARGLGISREQALAALAAAGVDPRRRAETLSLEEWGRLYQALKHLTSRPPSLLVAPSRLRAGSVAMPHPGSGKTRDQRRYRHRPERSRPS
jgi:16S rRNA (adenine1518-N6/adenine1519-N6)-dimethyltransferase